MQNRTGTYLCILLIVLATSGCAALRATGNASSEDQEKSKYSKDELWDRAKALDAEKAACLNQLGDRETELRKVQKELADQQAHFARTDQQLSQLNRTVGDLNANLTRLQETGTLPSDMKRQSLKIKVLAGDGKMASATRMSKKLRSIGYRVVKIDRAPRSNFKVHTVYYGPSRQPAAVSLVKRLGKGATVKPLDWPSAFDIIVVTGRRI